MVKSIALFIMIAAGYFLYTSFPESHGPGIIAKNEPGIERLAWQEPITYKGATIKPVKQITAEVRVIKRKHYYFDSFARYSPIDVLAGWKELSDERNLDYLYFSLDNRSYQLNYTKPPIDLSIIASQTDLWHLIPANADVENEMDEIRNGNIIYIKGMLVNIENDTDYEFVSATELDKNGSQKGFNIWVEELHIR